MNVFLGIDCGGTHLRVGLVDESGQILAYSRVKSPLVGNPSGFGKVVEDETKKLCKQVSLDLSDIKSVGLGVPGPIDAGNGWILYSANLGNKEPIKFLDQLKQSFPSLEIFFDRDGEVALIGEGWLGEAKGVDDVILLTLGTGIGGAIKAGGRIISGSSDHAGEIGHMYLTVNSNLKTVNSKAILPRCGLGHEGCFEAIFRAAKTEDKPYFLGVAMANLVDIFNPEKIILGGGIIEYNQIDVVEAEKVMQDKAFKPSGKEVKVVKAALGDRAGVVGAAYLAICRGDVV